MAFFMNVSFTKRQISSAMSMICKVGLQLSLKKLENAYFLREFVLDLCKKDNIIKT